MTDIGINCDDGKFKFRVCALIEQNGKFLVQRIMQNQFYCLPGGHVELGEDTMQAIKREVKEEINKEVKSAKLFAIMENFFKTSEGKVYHELGYYFVVEVEKFENQDDYEVVENDKGMLKTLRYKWVTPSEFDKIDFRPSILKDLIKNKKFESISHIVFKQ